LLGDVQIAGGLSPVGQTGQGGGEFGEVVAVAEAPGRGGQVRAGRGGIPGGQGQPAQHPVAPGHVVVPIVPATDLGIVAGELLGRAGTARAGQPAGPPDPTVRVQVIVVRVVGEADLVGCGEVPLGGCGVPDQVGQPPQVCVQGTNLLPVAG